MQLRHLTTPAYLLAALLVLFPLVDLFVSVYPLRPSEVSWRFGVTGLFSGAMLSPLLGLLLALATALIHDNRIAQRMVAVISGVTTVLVLAAMALFLLDALQMRAQVQPAAKTAFDLSTMMAVGKYIAGLILLIVLGLAAWRASRERPRTSTRGADRKPGSGILMGQR